MKIKEKEKARELRQEGLSILDIAKHLNVAKSSVSVWVRDIELTQEQKTKLEWRNPVHLRNMLMRKAVGAKASETWREKRFEYQEKGREFAKQNDILYVSGCMLYWAEGTKDKNSIRMTNSDIQMMQFFIRFLREIFHLENNDISIYINCYNDFHTVEEIEQYWLSILELPNSCLRKTTVNQYSSYSVQKRKGKLEYGTCKLVVNNTEYVQMIYGAIQEIAGFINKKWCN